MSDGGEMSDSDRAELAAKLDRELDEYLDKMEQSSSKYMDGWSEESWQAEMEQHPFFASKAPEAGQEMSPLLEGLQQIKYSAEHNTPEELAAKYKDDGNFQFQYKKYRLAVAAYSEGLRQKCSDEDLNAVLLANRAAANFRLGNFRSSLVDCRLAVAKKPDHVKAIVRAAECCLQLKRFDECRTFCAMRADNGDLKDLAAKADVAEKQEQRDSRKMAADARKKRGEEQTLLNAISRRGIRVQSVKSGGLNLDDLEPTHPAASRKRVHFSAEDAARLVWPVLFLYPEHGETDFVEEFDEADAFADHLQAMFGPATERPPWDVDAKYTPDRLRLYFEDAEGERLFPVDCDKSLNETISRKEYVVRGGTPAFIVLVDGSKFQQDFIKKYK